MKRQKSKSIRKLFTIWFVTVVSAVLLVFASILIMYNMNSVEDDLQKQISNMSKLAGISLSTALWQYNYEYVNDYVDSLFLNDDVVFACVLSGDTVVKKRTTSEFSNKPLEKFKKSSGFIVKETGVIYKNAIVGNFIIVMSRERILNSIINESIAAIILLFLIISAIAGVNYFLSETYLFRPLSRLKDSVTQIAEGDLDANIHSSETDEIGALAKSFVVMMDNLKRITASRDELDYEIHERIKTEGALRASEELFRLAFENANDGLCLVDPSGNFVSVNSRMTDILGYSKNKLEKLTLHSLTHPDDLDITTDFIDKCISGELDCAVFDKRYFHRDGQIIWTQISSSIIRNESDDILYFITHIRDITKRRKMEEALIKEKKRAEQYLQLAGVMFIGLDTSGHITLANRKSCEVLGCIHEDLIGVNWFDNFIPESIRSKIRGVFQQLLAGRLTPVEYYENRVVSKSGEEKIIAWHNALIIDSDNSIKGLICSGEDISIRKRFETQVLQSHKLEAIGTLAGGVAHDFNNLLGVITGNLSYAIDLAETKGELLEVLSDVQEGAKKAQSLTLQLLTFAKGGAPVKKATDLNALINNSAKFVTRGSKTKCEFAMSDNLWAAEIDPGQIDQVIGNLVINADQAMPEGGILSLRTENAVVDDTNDRLPAGKYIRIVIEDQGRGIMEENIASIFDPYFTTKQKGSGLGLATAYSIIKRHDGTITVYSEVNKGSVFHIYLPATDKVYRKEEAEMALNHQGKGRVLIMDDHASILKMAARMIGKMGYEIVGVPDGDEAIRIYKDAFLKGEPFDLVILDLTIPGGTGGAKTIPELIKINPDVKAVVSSGYSNDPVMANYKDYGFCGVVPKPYSKAQLAECLDTIFEKEPEDSVPQNRTRSFAEPDLRSV